MYSPIFKVTSRSINLVAAISAQLEHFALRMELEDELLLRRVNRIRSICGSLAIEGNTLSEAQVSDIINGRRVFGPAREIREVQNAVRAYDLLPSLEPFSKKDLLKAHESLMSGLTEDAGRLRRGSVGVFAGERAIHIAPPANLVGGQLDDLIEWTRRADDHMLIRSSVFHYEFEFIHPFSDGNGRTGRLWQTLLLSVENPLFAHVPIENLVYERQFEYYDAINESTAASDSGIFVEFMLEAILDSLKGKPTNRVSSGGHSNVGKKVGTIVGTTEEKALYLIIDNPKITAKELAARLSVTQRHAERLFASLKKNGLIMRVGANKNGVWVVR